MNDSVVFLWNRSGSEKSWSDRDGSQQRS